MEYTSAIRRCIQARPAGAPAEEAAALFKELSAAIRLAAKRLSLAGAMGFAGRQQVRAAGQQCSGPTCNGCMFAGSMRKHGRCARHMH